MEVQPMSLLDLTPQSMLVVAPHADDEVLGAGGLMALAQIRGWRVHVLYATVAGYRSMERGELSVTHQRRAEVEAALGVLGVSGYDVLFEGEEHHLRLDTVPQTELIGFVERGLAATRPAIALFPTPRHFHQDHRAVATACMAALRPAPDGERPFVRAVLAYGHPGAGWSSEGATFSPSVFVDIGTVLERKLAALECYTSQLCAPPHPRSLPAVRDACAVWGSLAGVRHAEAFECLRLIAF
jgi:N-acetylglucosamine malate deacetylase 1